MRNPTGIFLLSTAINLFCRVSASIMRSLYRILEAKATCSPDAALLESNIPNPEDREEPFAPIAGIIVTSQIHRCVFETRFLFGRKRTQNIFFSWLLIVGKLCEFLNSSPRPDVQTRNHFSVD